MFLTKEQILSAQDFKTEEVEVPEWDGKVRVKSLTAKERDRFEAGMIEGRGKDRKTNLENLRARLVAKTVVDEQGNLLFSEKDVDALGEKNAAAIDTVFAVAQRLSKLRPEDVEELTKNSDQGQSDDSNSG